MLDPRTCIAIVPGKPPILTRMVKFYERPDLGVLTRWRRFTRWVRYGVASVCFFAGSALLAMGLVDRMEGRPVFQPNRVERGEATQEVPGGLWKFDSPKVTPKKGSFK